MRDDFTRFPLGHKVFVDGGEIDEMSGETTGEVMGEIQNCPHCGRRGLAQTTPQGWTYTHTQVAEPNGDGTYLMDWDSCPKTSLSEEHR